MSRGPGASRPKAVVSWSSGKDSAYALQEARRSGEVEVVGLLTTVTRDFDRVAMHGVRRDLLERQARAVRLPLHVVEIPKACTNAVYDAAMRTAIERLQKRGVERIVFGDLFLEEIRTYREERLKGTGITPIFPLWGRPTGPLAHRMIDEGVTARLVCVDPRKLGSEFAGRPFDHALLDDLPEGCDPCGENGEFHTFVTAGPGFDRPLPVRTGRVVERDGFVFADLAPSEGARRPTRGARSRGSRRSP